MKLDYNYQEKVYSGVLGKIIGVYLGRPFEQWSHSLIKKKLGSIKYYVHKKLNKPLIVPDDDITGTFTFIRSLSDNGYKYNVSSKKIGLTWLNYIVENETILWWGGVGNSTEHTAFQNLKNGIHAPHSGSIKNNGKTIAEQIGAQIFIDGWPMICPGDPEKAINLAKRAANVSHDGEAVYAAQIIAAIESEAFINDDISQLLNNSKKYIPANSEISKLINQIQEWHQKYSDWNISLKKIINNYGYDKYLGSCHVIPNHALIIMSLLYGEGDFNRSMNIINSAGWDTDCNSGNVGCILGIKNGLKGFGKGRDWRSPVKDIMYCPTANGGETITDALREAYKIINITRKINNEKPLQPKNNARFHFEMPGSMQGWGLKSSKNSSLKNVSYESGSGNRALEISYKNLTSKDKIELSVDTFYPENVKNYKGEKKKTFFSYNFICCPLIYSGQSIKLALKASKTNLKSITFNIFVKVYSKSDERKTIRSKPIVLQKKESIEYEWKPTISDNDPIYEIGIEIKSKSHSKGKVYFDYLDIVGNPQTIFKRPKHVQYIERGQSLIAPPAIMWRNAWVKLCDHWVERQWEDTFRISNNKDRGMLITGNNQWKNYTVTSKINFESAKSAGICARFQGIQRYYALEITSDKKIRLVKMYDGIIKLIEKNINIKLNTEYKLSLSVDGNNLIAQVNNKNILKFKDELNPILFGAMGLIVDTGTISTNEVKIS